MTYYSQYQWINEKLVWCGRTTNEGDAREWEAKEEDRIFFAENQNVIH